MAHHKRQHYIPASYLKAWCDKNTPRGHTPYVWVFDADGKNSRQKAPENIFHESDMYTIERKDGSRDPVFERKLSQLEGTFSRIRKKTLAPRRNIDETDRFLLCVFIAAMHSRTPARREHLRDQWARPLHMMDQMNDWLSRATPEEVSRAMPPLLSRDSEAHISHEQVRQIHENPLQTTMPLMIEELTPLLAKLDMAILESPEGGSFITSDHPCVWSDDAAHKRHPMFQSPALMYETIEIALPVSPRQMIWLNRQGFIGYNEITVLGLDELNRRTRFAALDYFVNDRNETKPFWFDRGVEPPDSWARTHGQQAKETDAD